MRAFFAAAFLALVVVGSAPVSSAQESDDDGLRFEATTTFRLDPEVQMVLVTMDITVTNQVPDRGNLYTYFSSISVPALSEATDVKARRVGGGALASSLEEADGPQWSTLSVDLSPNLLYGRTQEIHLTYGLPDLPPRSVGWTRANAAYATFPVFAVGDPGLADVEVVIPNAFQVELNGGELDRDRRSNVTVYRAADIESPDDWFVSLVASNDDLMTEHPVRHDGHEIMIRGWPGDEEWAQFVQDWTVRGIPTLEDLLGQPWPVDGQLEIEESAVPHLYGYGGWYGGTGDVIEISDELDPELVLHELSHAWFDSNLFSDRWVIEGMAQEYAMLAVTAHGATPALAQQAPIDLGRAGAQPLLGWDHFNLHEEKSEEQEDYGYDSSWWLVHELATEIGPEGMADLIHAAVERDIAYAGDPDPELWVTGSSWRRTLDLFEEIGGSTAASDLFSRYVLLPEDRPMLDERTQARGLYAELVDAGTGWTAPLEVRQAMGAWDFAAATRLFDVAEQALVSRDAALGDLVDLGVDELPALELSYEASEDVEALVAEADEYAEMAGTLDDTSDDVAQAGALERFGLLGDDVVADLQGAAVAMADGDVSAADSEAVAAAETVDGAALTGGARYAMFAAALAGLGLIWRQRERRVGSGRWLTAGVYSSHSS
ncbi:MAG: hypothetical protein ACRDWI_14845 [Jiangellaceae bacterium]